MGGSNYRLVQLANGAWSVRSLVDGETLHPGTGPMAESQALYARQLRLTERPLGPTEELVVWDVGLGAAANALAVLRGTRAIPARLRLVSFDATLAALEFALAHAELLKFPRGYEAVLRRLVQAHQVTIARGRRPAEWEVHIGDFPRLVMSPEASRWPKPHAILFDPFSPAKNPAMWTQPLFARVFELLDPRRPCLLATYSRSTMVRVALLLAGFYVAAGHATGQKEETTIASNRREELEAPLDARWLQRAGKSTSAEPLWAPVYRQAKLAPSTWAALKAHPQFRGTGTWV